MNRKLSELTGKVFEDGKVVMGVDFSVKSVFIELTDDNQFRYDVTVTVDGGSMTIPFRSGSAHCDYEFGGADKWPKREVERLNGRKRSDGSVITLFDAIEHACKAGPANLTRFKLSPPDVDTVLWILAMDSYVTDHGSVGEFAEDYGYSIEDFDEVLTVWNQAHDQTRSIERLLRSAGLTIDDLREEYQDF